MEDIIQLLKEEIQMGASIKTYTNGMISIDKDLFSAAVSRILSGSIPLACFTADEGKLEDGLYLCRVKYPDDEKPMYKIMIHYGAWMQLPTNLTILSFSKLPE